MLWDNDEFNLEKYMIFDAIVAFMHLHSPETCDKISIKDLTDFVDGFIEKKNDPSIAIPFKSDSIFL